MRSSIGLNGVNVSLGHDPAGSFGPVERFSGVEEIGREWDRLAYALDAPPFLRAGWFSAWLESFGAGRGEIFALWRDSELAAVLPLVRMRRTLCAAANWHTPLYGPLGDPASTRELVTRVLASERLTRFDLTLLDGASLDAVAAAATASGARTVDRLVARQPFVDTSGDWSAYDERLPRKQRKELRRVRRRLEEEGELTVEFATGDEDLERLLDEGFAIEGSGWKSDAGTAIASDPALDRFYRDVARWARASGLLTLAFLRLDGRAIAFDLCLEAGGALYALKGGFDPEMRRFSPGTLLTYDSLERAFAAPKVRSYEFLGTDDDYKLAWADGTRARTRLQAFPRSAGGAAGYLAWTHGRSVAKRALAAAKRAPR